VKRALIVDTETTALTPETGRCIEIGCILYDLEHAAPIASYAGLFPSDDNPAMGVNGIRPELLRETFGDWTLPVAWANSSDVVLAHRAEFDRQWVPEEMLALPWVCTKFHVRWPRGKYGDHLVHLALAHGVPLTHAHRALTDCDTLARLLTRVAEFRDICEMIRLAMRPRMKVRALVSYDNRELAKSAGFAWDADRKIWWREVFEDEEFSFEVKRFE
jgi:DNA polymerase-3 subunit epsilon